MISITRLLLWSVPVVSAWTTTTTAFTTISRRRTCATATRRFTATTSDLSDKEEEYEYIEYEQLTEDELVGSEWLVGTCMDNNPNKIDETWLRLAVDPEGKNLAVWGDGAEGKWTIDPATGFFSASKETIWKGKEIWAGTADDYYFLQGTVRGWSFLSAANVLGQWQAKRLGVDPEEAGAAPWFEEQEQEAPAVAASVATEAAAPVTEEATPTVDKKDAAAEAKDDLKSEVATESKSEEPKDGTEEVERKEETKAKVEEENEALSEKEAEAKKEETATEKK